MRRATAIVFAALSLSAFAAFNPPKYTNSFTRAGVTYGQFGGVKSSNYVATAVNENALVGGYTGVVKRAAYASVAAQSTNSLLAVSATNIITASGPMDYKALTNAVLVASGEKVADLETRLTDGSTSVSFAESANYASTAGAANTADSLTDGEGHHYWNDITALTNGLMSGAALESFAETGTVARATTYGTPTRWTDATGCVWEVITGWRIYTNGVVAAGWTAWNYSVDATEEEIFWDLMIGLDEDVGTFTYSIAEQLLPYGTAPHWASEVTGVYSSDADYHGLVGGDTIRAIRGDTNLVGRVALTNDIPDVSGYTTRQQATNAAIAVADAKISTNNEAFVSAVLAVPIAGADAGDLAEISEYGGYGTVGAAVLALIAGLAALKRRVTSAETALAQKANTSDLHYRLVEPGKWEFSDGLNRQLTGPIFDGEEVWYYYTNDNLTSQDFGTEAEASAALSLSFGDSLTATRASLPGHLCDRAGNRVVVSGDTTLTLPEAVPGYLRDFLVRLEISGSTVPTITFSPDGGESVTYETDGDEFPVPDEAGTWLYAFTESCVSHKFAVSLKKVNEVAAPTQGGS